MLITSQFLKINLETFLNYNNQLLQLSFQWRRWKLMKAGAPPCLISTLLFFFCCKILDANNAFYSSYKAPLVCPTSSANRHLSASLIVLNQQPVTATSRPAEAVAVYSLIIALRQIDSSQQGGLMGAFKRCLLLKD